MGGSRARAIRPVDGGRIRAAARGLAGIRGGVPGGELPAPPATIGSPALAVRFLADDLKAYYMEAAQSDGGMPSINQINDWLFRETVAGQFLVALRRVSLASENNALKTAGGRFLVPAQWVPPQN